MTEERHRIRELEQEVEVLRAQLAAAERVSQGACVHALTESREQAAPNEIYRLFFEHMREGALIVSDGGTIRYCNEALARMLATPVSNIIGRKFEELVAGDAANRSQQLLGTENRSVESGLRAQTGETVPVLISFIRPMAIHGRRVYGLIVTDLRRHEPRLHHNALLQASKDAIYALSPSLEIKTWNRGAESIFGYAPAEIIGKSERDLCPASELPALEELVRQVRERGAAVTVDAVRRRKDRTKIRVLLSMTPIRELDGRMIGYGVVAHDVTERERAARQLRDAMARTSLALEAGRMGTFEMDLNTERCTWSDQVYAICGLDKGSFEPTLGSVYGIVHPEDRPVLVDCLEAAQRGGSFEADFRIRHRDGRYIWIHSRGMVRLDAEGKPQELFGVVFDITERKETERKQQLLVGELNHRVRNTLATVQAIASQTLRRAKSPEDFVQSFSDRIQALSRAHTLLTRTAWQGAELDSLIREQLMLGSGDRIKYHGPAVSLEPQTALQLALVLHELGTNARKYGSLSVPQGRVTVDWSIQQSGKDRILEIVWKERGGPSVSQPSSTGFGTLLIERSLQQGHGGESRISFDPEGVTCVIRLPLSRSEVPASQPAPSTELAASRPS